MVMILLLLAVVLLVLTGALGTWILVRSDGLRPLAFDPNRVRRGGL